ncbi:MAG: ABC transporter substrate binding protein [Rhodospirillaceae bacterium]|nr:ABC transporter substrate binding protein [Rhodospirillaceae bacterium]
MHRSLFSCLRRVRGVFLSFALIVAGLAGPGAAFGADADIPAPPEKKIFRIGYLEAGPYWNYPVLLDKIRSGLEKAGWGGAVRFPDEVHVSLGWGEESRKTYNQRVRDMFAKGGFDILLSFGTEATKIALAENPGRVPIVGVSISDPLAAGLVAGPEDSGVRNFTTALNVSPGSFMVMIFSRITDIKKLGVMYNDSEAGRMYAYVADAREVGREYGFEVLEYPYLSPDETVGECLTGAKALVERGATALFIPNLRCVDLAQSDPAALYDFLDSRKIPVFTGDDREQVRRFALAGLLPYDEGAMAAFHVNQIARILSGAVPGDLPMVLPFNFRLLINLEAAQRNGVVFSEETLVTTDEIYLKRYRGPETAPRE